MKNILLTSIAALTMIVTGIQAEAATIAKGTTFKLKLVSITKTENSQLKPKMKIFDGAPVGLKTGQVYQFKIDSKSKLTGPEGINIAYASERRFTALNLTYLQVPGAAMYLDYKTSGTQNLNTFIEFAAAFQNGNSGKPVSLTLNYIDADVTPKFSAKQVVYVFEKP